jgi:hypothetical protein
VGLSESGRNLLPVGCAGEDCQFRIAGKNEAAGAADAALCHTEAA